MKIEITLGEIDKALKQLAEYQEELVDKTRLVVEKLAFLGATNASLEYSRAITDQNDVQVDMEWINTNTMRIRASGSNTAIRFNFLLSAIKSSLYGVLTVLRKVAIVSFINATWM